MPKPKIETLCTTGDISRKHGINRQTVHLRLLVLGIDPKSKVGNVRLYSPAQVKKIVNFRDKGLKSPK